MFSTEVSWKLNHFANTHYKIEPYSVWKLIIYEIICEGSLCLALSEEVRFGWLLGVLDSVGVVWTDQMSHEGI